MFSKTFIVTVAPHPLRSFVVGLKGLNLTKQSGNVSIMKSTRGCFHVVSQNEAREFLRRASFHINLEFFRKVYGANVQPQLGYESRKWNSGDFLKGLATF